MQPSLPSPLLTAEPAGCEALFHKPNTSSEECMHCVWHYCLIVYPKQIGIFHLAYLTVVQALRKKKKKGDIIYLIYLIDKKNHCYLYYII